MKLTLHDKLATVVKNAEGDEKQTGKGFGHLKWPVILIIIFIFLLIFFLDHLYREGNI